MSEFGLYFRLGFETHLGSERIRSHPFRDCPSRRVLVAGMEAYAGSRHSLYHRPFHNTRSGDIGMG